jgi:2,5-diketo-D-gluconate reductase B
MNVYVDNGFERIFGTWPMQGAHAQRVVESAIDIGYRAIDTAQMYGNEDAVGAAIKASAVPRDELFITTKIHPDNFTQSAFMPSLEASLNALQLPKTDVLLLHWPPLDGNVTPSLKLLNEALKSGLADHVGVSNYNIAMMEDAQRIIDGPVAVNQVEFHPLLDQSRLLEGASRLGIPLSAYCSIAKGKVFDDPVLRGIGAAKGKSAAQVALRWCLQKGVAVNTKSETPKNILSNLEITDFALSDDEMAQIDGLGAQNYRIVSGSGVPFGQFWE